MQAQDLASKMMAEIEEDFATGILPHQVNTFSQLHDHVDANCYGGLCEDDTFNSLIERFGGRDEHEGMPQGMIDLINEAQNIVDLWLRQRTKLH